MIQQTKGAYRIIIVCFGVFTTIHFSPTSFNPRLGHPGVFVQEWRRNSPRSLCTMHMRMLPFVHVAGGDTVSIYLSIRSRGGSCLSLHPSPPLTQSGIGPRTYRQLRKPSARFHAAIRAASATTTSHYTGAAIGYSCARFLLRF